MHHAFHLDPSVDLATLAEGLPAGFRADEPVGEPMRRLYLDTHDWCLTDRGGPLRVDETTEVWVAVRESAETGEARDPVAVAGVPGGPMDLPEGALRDAALKATRIRAFLPMAEVEGRCWQAPVRNGDGQVVVRLHGEEGAARVPRDALLLPGQGAADGAARALPRRLELLPVKGYGDELAEVAAALAWLRGVEPATATPFAEAVAAAGGRRPGDYSSRIDIRLKRKQPAAEAARRIHRHLLTTLEANIEGARTGRDTEFLHDLRVSTRRIRSALAGIKGVFPPGPLADFKERFRWLGNETGPTRDLDVFLLVFDDYRARLPEPLRDELGPFRDFLERRHREEQQALARRLASPHFRKLLKDWHAFLEAEPPAGEEAPNAERPARAVADEQIWKRYRRVLKEGRAINDDSPHTEIHELRKSCKKLRYLLEFFQDLYPSKRIQPPIKAIKALLDHLGEFQDREVHAQRIREFARAMADEGTAPAETLLAMGALVDDLLRQQSEVRAAFPQRFAEFDNKATGRAFKKLFKPAGKGG